MKATTKFYTKEDDFLKYKRLSDFLVFFKIDKPNGKTTNGFVAGSAGIMTHGVNLEILHRNNPTWMIPESVCRVIEHETLHNVFYQLKIPVHQHHTVLHLNCDNGIIKSPIKLEHKPESAHITIWIRFLVTIANFYIKTNSFISEKFKYFNISKED